MQIVVNSITSKKKVLVTGASGYVGKSIVDSLRLNDAFELFVVVRDQSHGAPITNPVSIDHVVSISDITHVEDWTDLLKSIDIVIHAAAVVHQNISVDVDYLLAANATATKKLASDAKSSGVKQFIFLSSVAVYAKCGDVLISEDSETKPDTHYGESKLMAEQYLNEISKNTQMKVVVLRPPMIYGPECPGNFSTLVALIRKPIPLPLGSINSKRSLLGIDNFISLITQIVSNAPVSGTYNVADADDLTFIDLLETVQSGVGARNMIFKFPLHLLRAIVSLVGKSSQLDKITESICLNTDLVHSELKWVASNNTRDAIKSAASSFTRPKIDIES